MGILHFAAMQSVAGVFFFERTRREIIFKTATSLKKVSSHLPPAKHL
jgi:hypothetical protein